MLYSNLMYEAAGHVIELQTGKTWEQFVLEQLFEPLEMHSSGFTLAALLAQPEYAVPFNETGDRKVLSRISSRLRGSLGR